MKRTKSKYPTPAQLAERREWASRFYFCWICECSPPAIGTLETHEIASRARAPNKWADVRNYFFTCRTCHDEILSTLPEAQQLAFKKMHDPDNYDRAFICKIRGEADTAITEYEVKGWLRLFQTIRGGA